jgi:hypothetical protein
VSLYPHGLHCLLFFVVVFITYNFHCGHIAIRLSALYSSCVMFIVFLFLSKLSSVLATEQSPALAGRPAGPALAGRPAGEVE